VAAVDLDGDLDPDLVSANAGSDDVSVLVNQGDGTFAAAVSYGVRESPQSVVAVELDGDGLPDLAAANRENNNVSVLMGFGDATFAPDIRYDVGRDPQSVVFGDLDADGDTDLVVTNPSTPNQPNGSGGDDVSVLLNEGDGTFAPETTYAVGSHPAAAAIGDFDGDGGLDLAAANANDGTVSILFNLCPPCLADLDGSGAVTTADLLAMLAAWGSAANGPPDLNGDGIVGTADLLALLAAWGPCP
jgi:hypothetical protein